MEQEVLKAFVSGNPLDGLYLYIKKFSFLNQIIAQEQVQKFIVYGYIKEVQRAKKKWFFIKIEDISTNWEFFIRDSLDFHRFDLVILYGSKNNGRVYLDKIIKTDYETLVKLAGGKYDPEWTVARAKKERYGDQKHEEIEKIKAESRADDAIKKVIRPHEEEELPNADEEAPLEEIFPEEENENEEVISEQTCDTSNENETHEIFTLTTLPDNLEKIQLLADILKNHEGEFSVLILNQEKKVSEEGLSLLKANF